LNTCSSACTHQLPRGKGRRISLYVNGGQFTCKGLITSWTKSVTVSESIQQKSHLVGRTVGMHMSCQQATSTQHSNSAFSHLEFNLPNTGQYSWRISGVQMSLHCTRSSLGIVIWGEGTCENQINTCIVKQLLHLQLVAGRLLVVRYVVVIPRSMEIHDQPGCLLAAESLQISLQPDVLRAAWARIHVASQVDHVGTFTGARSNR
jgi:hypothetical protein